jgi:hypothetical protein
MRKLIICNYGDKNEKDNMDGAHFIHEGDDKRIGILVRNPECRRLVGRPSRRW